MLKSMVVSLLLTLVLEGLFACLWGLRSRRELTVVALVNIMTNPAVVLLYHTGVSLLGWSAVFVTAALESAAVLAEWIAYRACSEALERPFLFALLANAFSYGAGLLINLL